MHMNQTKIYNFDEFKDDIAKELLREVIVILEERGYDAINQIVGYLMSGDPGYITSYKDARGKLTSVDRSKLLEILVKELRKTI